MYQTRNRHRLDAVFVVLVHGFRVIPILVLLGAHPIDHRVCMCEAEIVNFEIVSVHHLHQYAIQFAETFILAYRYSCRILAYRYQETRCVE
jgi:hypothetical protein